MPKRKARKSLFSTDDAGRKAARVELERYERPRTTRVAACCEGKDGYFKRQDTEERRYFRLQYDAVRRAGPTLWFSCCGQ